MRRFVVLAVTVAVLLVASRPAHGFGIIHPLHWGHGYHQGVPIGYWPVVPGQVIPYYLVQGGQQDTSSGANPPTDKTTTLPPLPQVVIDNIRATDDKLKTLVDKTNQLVDLNPTLIKDKLPPYKPPETGGGSGKAQPGQPPSPPK
jgi:hypothetical protein